MINLSLRHLGDVLSYSEDLKESNGHVRSQKSVWYTVWIYTKNHANKEMQLVQKDS